MQGTSNKRPIAPRRPSSDQAMESKLVPPYCNIILIHIFLPKIGTFIEINRIIER